MDIRNFFGGKKEKPKESCSAASSTSHSPKKKQKTKNDEVKQCSKKPASSNSLPSSECRNESKDRKKAEKKDVKDKEELEDSDDNDFEEDGKKRRLQQSKVTKKAKKNTKTEKEKKLSKSSAPASAPAPPAPTLAASGSNGGTSSSPLKSELDEKKKKKEQESSKKAAAESSRKRKEVLGGARAFFGSSQQPQSSSVRHSPKRTLAGKEKEVEQAEALLAHQDLKKSPTKPQPATASTHTPKQSSSALERKESPKKNTPEKTVIDLEEEERSRKKAKTLSTEASSLSVEDMKRYMSSKRGLDEYSTEVLRQRVEELQSVKATSSQCLRDVRIAFTGVMERFASRDKLEDLFLGYGAKIAKSVTKTTDFVVAADEFLEDGRPVSSGKKHQQAVERKIPILSEKEAVILLLFAIDNSSGTSAQDVKQAVPQMSAAREKAISSAYSVGKAVEVTTGNQRSTSTSSVRSVSSTALLSDSTAQKQELESHSLLWVDKYKPTRLEEVVGGTENIKKLVDWLKRWDDVHVKKKQKVAFSKENPGAKAALISGPPGIGKTTLATLIAKTMGYEVLELNASDARNKKAIEEQLKDVVFSRALSMTGAVKKRLVVMDEVDGMGGSDRGGIPELIKVIKSALNPIICLCNDRQAMKIRSLAGHCFDIRLRRPTKSSIAQRLVQIGRQENLTIESNAAELLVEQMGNDIRQCINAAQMWKAQSDVMRYTDLRAPPPSVYGGGTGGTSDGDSGGRMKSIEKDKILRQSPFDACGMILGGSKNDFNERYNSFFIDYSLLPLLLQQNYIDSSLNGISKMRGIDDAEKMHLLSKAADSVSEMELLGAQVRGNDQHWELLPAQASLCMRAGSIVQGYQSFPTFPQWLGKNSTTSKNKRLTQELVMHTQLRAGQGFESIRLEYIYYLKFILTRLLKKFGNDTIPALEGDSPSSPRSGVQEVIRVLDSYGLSRDDLMDTMPSLQFVVAKDPNLQDLYSFMDSKLKAALTREYNSGAHCSQGLMEPLNVKKKKKTPAADDDDEAADTTEDLGASKEVEEEDSDAELEAFMKKHAKKPKGKGKAKAAKKPTSKKK